MVSRESRIKALEADAEDIAAVIDTLRSEGYEGTASALMVDLEHIRALIEYDKNKLDLNKEIVK